MKRIKKLIYSKPFKAAALLICILFSIYFVYDYSMYECDYMRYYDIETKKRYYTSSDESFQKSEYMLDERNRVLDILFSIAEDMSNGKDIEAKINKIDSNKVNYFVGAGGISRTNFSSDPEDYKEGSEGITEDTFYYIKDFDESIERYPREPYYNYDVNIYGEKVDEDEEKYYSYESYLNEDGEYHIEIDNDVDNPVILAYSDAENKYIYKISNEDDTHFIEIQKPIINEYEKFTVAYTLDNGNKVMHTFSPADFKTDSDSQTEQNQAVSENVGNAAAPEMSASAGTDKTYAVYMEFNMGEFYADYHNWGVEKNEHNVIFLVLVMSALGIILCEIFLIFVTGENGIDKKIKTSRIDNVFGEIMIVAGAGIFIFGTAEVLEIIHYSNRFGPEFFTGISAITALTALICTEILLSLVRSFKKGEFLKRFGIIKMIFAGRNGIKNIFGKSVLRQAAALLLIYSAVIAFLPAAFDGFGLVMAAVIFVFVCIKLYDFASEADSIKSAIKEIRNGNTSFKVKVGKGSIFSDAASDINEIGEGFDKAFEEKMKSERLKSELITNVSHDLKTPLTSIINYSQLLCEQELQPEEANDYSKIIYDKSCKLKSITSDLFDISKVQSGNDEAEIEKLDICLLMNQALGELDSSIRESGLEFIKSFEKENIFINADGKKMSRAFENLIINCLKYSLSGTRVYISIKTGEGKVRAEIKNIASYRMNFDEKEITERFVRGDISRSTDGNGLGLAIVKSYTEVCGGTFDIITDADLFKVEITFSEAEES